MVVSDCRLSALDGRHSPGGADDGLLAIEMVAFIPAGQLCVAHLRIWQRLLDGEEVPDARD